MGIFKRFWGMPVEEILDNGKIIWKVIIVRPFIRKDKEPMFGLNYRLLDKAINANATLQVEFQDRDVILRISPLEIVGYKEIHKEPSKLYPGTTFNIFLYPIPKDEIGNLPR